MIAAAALFLFFAGAASFESLLRSGLVALQKNDLEAARTQLEAAVKIEPRNPKVWLGLAQTYWKLRQPDPADSAARRAEALGSNDPLVVQGLLLYYSETAKSYIASGQPENAIPQLQAAFRLRPHDEVHCFELAQLLLQLQKFGAALDVLNTGLQRFDKSAQLELARGVALYGLRRFSEAIDSFLRAIELAPDVPQPYLFLGRMLDQAESKLPDIVRAFAALARSDPQNFMGSFLYAKALIAQSGDSSQAESLLRASVSRKRDYWESHFELGLLLERRRQFGDAAAELEKAIALNPDGATAHYRLARIYDRLGKSEQAKAEHALHEKLAAEETAAIQKHAAGLKRLELVVK